MRKYKGFIIGFILGAVICSSTAVFAANIQTQMWIVAMFIDGKRSVGNAQGIFYGGDIYLPAKYISSHLGMTYSYNNSNGMISLNSIAAPTPSPQPAPTPTPAPTPSPQQELTIQQISLKAVGVVYIEAKDQNGKAFASGSGIIINNKIVTNYHVIDKAFFISFTTDAGQTYNISSVSNYDADRDIAILNTDAPNLTSLAMGDSSKLVIGDGIVAIGSPLGLQNTVSNGIVSSFRTIDEMNYIQISVPINHGSSGGALFNMAGEVVGVTTSGYVDTTGDLNFAIPVNEVKPLFSTNLNKPLSQLYSEMHPQTANPTYDYIVEVEPNDYYNTADIIDINNWAYGYIDSLNDVDCFKFQVTGTNARLMLFGALGSSVSGYSQYLSAGIRDANGNLLYVTRLWTDPDSYGTYQVIDNVSLSQGTYYITIMQHKDTFDIIDQMYFFTLFTY